MGKNRKRKGFVAVYDGGLKFVYLGLVLQKRWNVSYYSRPAGDENEHDDVNPQISQITRITIVTLRAMRNL